MLHCDLFPVSHMWTSALQSKDFSPSTAEWQAHQICIVWDWPIVGWTHPRHMGSETPSRPVAGLSVATSQTCVSAQSGTAAHITMACCAELASCKAAVESEILMTIPSVHWGDIAGMTGVKRVLQEAVVLPSMRPDIFTGLRAPTRGVFPQQLPKHCSPMQLKQPRSATHHVNMC